MLTNFSNMIILVTLWISNLTKRSNQDLNLKKKHPTTSIQNSPYHDTVPLDSESLAPPPSKPFISGPRTLHNIALLDVTIIGSLLIRCALFPPDRVWIASWKKWNRHRHFSAHESEDTETGQEVIDNPRRAKTRWSCNCNAACARATGLLSELPHVGLLAGLMNNWGPHRSWLRSVVHVCLCVYTLV